MNQFEKRRDKLTSDEMKISRLLELLLLFLAVMFLSSCSSFLPVPQEMGNMALLRTFAVDESENSHWKVTVSTGLQAKGLQGDQEPPTILVGESETLQGACRLLEGQTDHTVFYGYVDQLVISTDLASMGVEKVLEYFASNSQLSLGTGIWLTQGSGEDLLTATSDEGAEAYLGTITQESHLGTAGITRKVGEVLTEIRELGGSFVPVVSSNGVGILEEKGYGIIKGQEYVALLHEEEARGLALLKEHDHLLEVETLQGVYAVNLSQIDTCYKGIWDVDEDDHKLNSVEISLEIQGNILEYPSLPTAEEQEQIKRESETELELFVLKTLKKLQDLQVDPLNIGGEIALGSPQHTQILREHWEELFPDIDFDVNVELNLQNVEGF